MMTISFEAYQELAKKFELQKMVSILYFKMIQDILEKAKKTGGWWEADKNGNIELMGVCGPAIG